MKLIFHGAAGEVGRSCIELCYSDGSENRRVLLDAGFKIHEGGVEHPTSIKDLGAIDAAFISHAHLDHIGSLPYLDHIGLDCPLFMTGMTRKLSKVMLEDSFHLELLRHSHPAYSEMDLQKVFRSSQMIKYYTLMRYKGLEFEFIPSGHIPGSAMVLMIADGKTVLYSGDVNFEDSRLIHGLKSDFLKRHKIDTLILESTYGNREHPDRKKEEKLFQKEVTSVIQKGGSLLLPAFSIGRAQELLMLIAELNLGVPIYLDGMAKKITRLFVGEDLHIRNSPELKAALENVVFVNSPKQRNSLLHAQSIIITTSGMVSGGPVMEYIKHFWHSKNDAIILTGFQGQGTNGRSLLENHSAVVDGMHLNFNSRISRFDFSGHAGKDGLINFVKCVSPETLILNHGDHDALASLMSEVLSTVPNVKVPRLDEEIFF